MNAGRLSERYDFFWSVTTTFPPKNAMGGRGRLYRWLVTSITPSCRRCMDLAYNHDLAGDDFCTTKSLDIFAVAPEHYDGRQWCPRCQSSRIAGTIPDAIGNLLDWKYLDMEEEDGNALLRGAVLPQAASTTAVSNNDIAAGRW
jgi:hypothetical protein